MVDFRPNPNEILEQIKSEENLLKRGKLKIFFGYAAGVGKTYAMLEAAHEALKAGVDVVAGYIEPHTRPETMNLLEGLEQIPILKINKKGVVLNEFNLDFAIKRHPKLILVDELAHTNIQGSRHLKRYQDIEELLKAGIDVYTTINVQHIESLNDIVASITGIIVRERIPDKIFDDANQVELVDIEPDDLIDRLNKGKVYKEKQAQKALENFFIKENLVALREIALRRTADQVNKIVEKNKLIMQNSSSYINEHILICLSSSPSNAKVIRTAARMANAFHGLFTALLVETPKIKKLSSQDQSRLLKNLKLAEQLGAKIVTVFGDDLAIQIAEYAKASGVSKIVIGRSNNKRNFIFSSSSLIDRLTDLAPNLNIFIIPDSSPNFKEKYIKKTMKKPVFSVLEIFKTFLILTVATTIGFLFFKLGFSESNIITVYILGVLFTAILTKVALYSYIYSIVSVLVFNFFFTYPHFTFQAYDPSYPVTFLVMFSAAFITSTLTRRVKDQAYQSALKAYRTEVLLETSQKLQRTSSVEEVYHQMAKQLHKLLDRTILIYPVENNKLSQAILFDEDSIEISKEYMTNDEKAVAQWVFKNNKNAGATTNTLPASKCLYMAVRSNELVFAVVGIAMNRKLILESFEKNLLIGMLNEFALSLEKESIEQKKKEIVIQAQKEQLRANLLRAISHDLRTPLTSISGNAGILMDNSNVLDEYKKIQLYTDIYDDSMWLINLVENLLSVTRIDNGSMNIKMQAEFLEEVIEEALKHVNRKKVEHNLVIDLKEDFLMAYMDSRLIIQVLINIVDNAIKYTPIGSTITLRAFREKDFIIVEIEDNGDGISDEIKDKLFDMFFTIDNNKGDSRRGLGLGLSLCQSIIHAHKGEIFVKDNKPRGTIFYFSLKAKDIDFELNEM